MATIPTLQKDDFGKTIKVRFVDPDGAAVNISAATTMNIYLYKPRSVGTITGTASFTTDGTDGYIEFDLTTGQLTPAGEWEIQGRVQSSGSDLRTKRGKFTVLDNIA